VIDGLPGHRDDHAGGIGRVLARLVPVDPAAVEGWHELHPAEGKLVRSPDVHAVARRALIGAELRQLIRGDDRRLMPLRQGDGVAEVIP